MTPDLLKRIFDEARPDFSAEVCAGATLDDLDSGAVELFRTQWAASSD
jgi:ATP-dependent DNA helicase RecG